MAEHELYLSDALGHRLAVIDRFKWLEWSRVLNDVGVFSVSFGAEMNDWRLFQPDRRLELWRVLDTGLSQQVRTYFIRRVTREVEPSGNAFVTVTGLDLNNLLARRIVAAPAASAEASKSGPADDMLKAVVREQLGPDAAPERDLSALGFSVAGDLSLAPSIQKAFARRNVLLTCQDIALASYAVGTPLYFDIVSPTATTLEFRTYVGYRGTDRTSTRTPFSVPRGTLAAVSLSNERMEEANYIYAAGQGVEDEREVVEVSNANAIAVSPWNRCEALADGRNYSNTDSLRSFGNVALQERGAKARFRATLADMPGSRFQVDWELGDLIMAEYDEEQFICEITAINGRKTPEEERIVAHLDRVR